MLEVSFLLPTIIEAYLGKLKSHINLQIHWDTTGFNDPNDWPLDGSQPFYLSTGDNTGYSQHGDYVFGCKWPSFLGLDEDRTNSMSQGRMIHFSEH